MGSGAERPPRMRPGYGEVCTARLSPCESQLQGKTALLYMLKCYTIKGIRVLLFVISSHVKAGALEKGIDVTSFACEVIHNCPRSRELSKTNRSWETSFKTREE